MRSPPPSCRQVVWDAGSRDKIRPLLSHFFPTLDGFFWVVDSGDRLRLEESREELWRTLNDPNMDQFAPLVVLANKQGQSVLPRAVDSVSYFSRKVLLISLLPFGGI